MPDRKTLAGSVAGAFVVGALGASLFTGGNAPVPVENALNVAKPINGTFTSEFATDIVQPGARAKASVYLPDGARGFALTKEAAGRFSIVAAQTNDHALQVTVENTSDKPARFTATFQYDGGRVP